MSSAYKKLLNFISRHPIRLLSIGMLIYIAVFTYLSFWKYDNFLYNALDLGIYSQVFESFRSGNHWYSSIQQSSYLGDHFEPFILALLPFYLLIPHPKTLLVLQTIFLSLPAIPIFFIARTIFQQTTSLSLGIAFFYLLNPLVHNINLFEFHLLPFSLVFLFGAAYFYIKSSYLLQTTYLAGRRAPYKLYYFLFLFFSFLAFLTREDVSLIIFMFGALALIERRRWYWIISPMVLGAWWFLLSMKIISAFNIDGGYKFLIYYSDIFNSNPFEFVAHIFGKAGNWEMILGILMAFIFLPFFQPRFLIIALAPFLQFTLLNAGATGVVWQIHYAAFFLPALVLSAIFGLDKIFLVNKGKIKSKPSLKIYEFIAPVIGDQQLRKFIVVIGTVSITILLGPLNFFIPGANPAREVMAKNEARTQSTLIKDLPAGASVLASSEYLSVNKINQNASALFYLFGGSKQYSDAPYIPPFDTNYVLINSDDLLGLYLTYGASQGGAKRIRDFLQDRNLFLEKHIDRFALFSKKPAEEALYKVLDSLPDSSDAVKNNQTIDKIGKVELIARTRPEFSQTIVSSSGDQFPAASFLLFWEKKSVNDNLYALEIIVNDAEERTVLKKIYPIAHGIYPVSDWEIGKIIETNQRILLPDNLLGEYELSMNLIDVSQGSVALNSVRTTILQINQKPAGERIVLGSIIAP